MELLDMLLKGMGGASQSQAQRQQEMLNQQYQDQQEALRQQQAYQNLQRQQQQQQGEINIPASSIMDLANDLGVSPDKVQDIIKMTLPLIIGKLGQNSQTDSGASALERALNDHSTRNYNTTKDIDLNDGQKILGHIFGNDTTGNISKQLSQKEGMDTGQIMKILSFIAPLALMYLSKKKTQTNQSVKDITRQYSDELNRNSGGSLYDALKNLPDNQQSQQDGGGLLGGLLGSLLGLGK